MLLRCQNFPPVSETKDGRRTLKPRVLIIAPTRELAVQVNATIRSVADDSFPSYCVYGGTDRNTQISDLERLSPSIICGTPGRLKDFLQSKCFCLDEVEFLGKFVFV